MVTNISKITINAAPQQVWDALTLPEQVKQWQYGSELTTSWEPGSPIRFTTKWEDTIFEQWGTIIDIQPYTSISYNLFAPRPGLEDRPEHYFIMNYLLTEKDGGTELEIRQLDDRPGAKQEPPQGEENPVLQNLKKVAELNEAARFPVIPETKTMNLAYKHLLNPGFSPYSRVWVYQSSRLLSLSEAFEAEDLIREFVGSWASHSDEVKAEGHLFFGQFVVLIADETLIKVSGCSTDSSVRFLKKLGETFKVDFFDRQNLAFVKNNKIEIVPLSQVKYALQHQILTPDTLYFNNLVLNRSELENDWIIPVKNSWLAKKTGIAV